MTVGGFPVPGHLPDCPTPLLRTGAVGIDHVDVVDDPPVVTAVFRPLPAGVTLRSAGLLDRAAYALTGGTRRFPRVIRADEGDPAQGPAVVLTLDQAGDSGRYTLVVTAPLVDPFFAECSLSFRLGCAAGHDCLPGTAPVQPAPRAPVTIDYLSKDYAGFRQALLDFLATRPGAWPDRGEADLATTVLELVAATGDTLSYLQDRIAAEAFLETATQRRSVQGHLALLGYRLDEGASAQTWLHFEVTRPHRLLPGFAVTADATGSATDGTVVFQTVEERALDPRRNELRLYDWDLPGCHLPAGATSVALVGEVPALQAGESMMLVDTESGRSDVVQLADVTVLAPDAITAHPTLPLTVATWSASTPLSGDYRIDTSRARANLVRARHGISVREDAVVPGDATTEPADNALVVPPSGPAGRTYAVSAFGFDPDPVVEQLAVRVLAPDGTSAESVQEQNEPGGLRDHVVDVPDSGPEGIWTVTVTGTSSGRTATAHWRAGTGGERTAAPSGTLRVRLSRAPLSILDGPLPAGLPDVSVGVDGRPWAQLPTLIEARPEDEVYRVELDDEGYAAVVFGEGRSDGQGDDVRGRRPPAGARLTIDYRIGRGTLGNVGAGTLTTPVSPGGGWLTSVVNGVPATGGRDPESLAAARRLAPARLASRQVAVTPEDYEAVAIGAVDATGRPLLSSARAAMRWTGSWYTATVTVQPAAAAELDSSVEQRLVARLDRQRLAGYDVQVVMASPLALDLRLVVCIRAGHLPEEVVRAVRSALVPVPGVPGSGRPPVFAPERLRFGQPLHVSDVYAAVMAVPGVVAARIETLAPLHASDPASATEAVKAAGRLVPGGDQVIQLADDPDFPERGRLRVRAVPA